MTDKTHFGYQQVPEGEKSAVRLNTLHHFYAVLAVDLSSIVSGDWWASTPTGLAKAST